MAAVVDLLVRNVFGVLDKLTAVVCHSLDDYIRSGVVSVASEVQLGSFH